MIFVGLIMAQGYQEHLEDISVFLRESLRDEPFYGKIIQDFYSAQRRIDQYLLENAPELQQHFPTWIDDSKKRERLVGAQLDSDSKYSIPSKLPSDHYDLNLGLLSRDLSLYDQKESETGDLPDKPTLIHEIATTFYTFDFDLFRRMKDAPGTLADFFLQRTEESHLRLESIDDVIVHLDDGSK